MKLSNRELDVRVAKEVMGLKKVCTEVGNEGFMCSFDTGPAIPIPNYSTDVAAAWEVVLKVDPDRVWEIGEWWQSPDHRWTTSLGGCTTSADTITEAICLTALMVAEENKD